MTMIGIGVGISGMLMQAGIVIASDLTEGEIASVQEYIDSAVTVHAEAVTDVHGADVGPMLAVLYGGGQNIYVQATAPTAANTYDLWIAMDGS